MEAGTYDLAHGGAGGSSLGGGMGRRQRWQLQVRPVRAVTPDVGNGVTIEPRICAPTKVLISSL